MVLASSMATSQELRIRVLPRPVSDGSATQVKRLDQSQMLRLMVTYEPRNQDELKKFIRELQDPKSARYHKFLTFEQWKARYAPTDADVAKAHAWADQHGLKLLNHFRNNLATNFEADSKTVEQAFNVQLHHYTSGDRRFFSSDRDPVVPAELAGIVKNIHGLNNYHRVRPANAKPSPSEDDEPIYRAGEYFRHESAHHSAKDEDGIKSGLKPRICCGFVGLELQDLYSSQVYDLTGLARFSQCCNPTNNPGSSPPETSIAIIGNNFLSINSDANNDLDHFAKQYGYAYNVDEQGHNSPSCCNGEMTLDVETAVALGNNFGDFHNTAHVWAYGTGGNNIGNLLDSWQFAHSDDHARVASSSFGAPESSFDDSTRQDYEHVIDAMYAEGWAVSVATGDHGATQDCSNLSVTFPASNPEIVAVGGTTLSENTVGGQPQFSSEVSWTGPGCNGLTGNASNNGGGGGGCSSHYDPPPYQTIVAGAKPCNDANKRALPDVSLNAGTSEQYYYNGGWTGFVGTSIASPAFAGFMAQVHSYLLSLGNVCGGVPFDSPCAPLGAINTRLWIMGALGVGTNGRSVFYDTTSGCNGGDGSITGYCAGTGYDLATGWGSVNMFQLGWAFIQAVTHDTVPQVNFTGPATNAWYNNDQRVHFSLSAPSPAGTSAGVGIAGYTGQWDSAVVDVKSAATPGAGNTFYDGPAKTGTGDFLSLFAAGQGCHTANVMGWDNAGRTTDNQTYGQVCLDLTPPTATCGAADGLWHKTDVSVHCTGADQANLSGLANAADGSFNLTTNVPAPGSASASTNSHQVCDVAGNCITAGPICCNMIDKAPPAVGCGSPDGLWHANDVVIPCTGADQAGLSGLAVPGDASFGLSTSVPALTETSSAFTNSHQVCDVATNCVSVGPLGPNMVDKKPPTVTITSPTATQYTHSSTFALNYSVTDGGSGVGVVAPTMNGSPTVGGIGLPSGRVINLLTSLPLGPNTFAVNAADNVGNKSQGSVTFTIIVTAQSMIDDVKLFFASGAINSLSVESGLLQKLNDASASRTAGQCGTAGNIYSAFINQVMGQTGKAITPTAAAVLIGDAQYLITHCP
jgi:hypothetical protein